MKRCRGKRMKWKTGGRAEERERRKAVVQGLANESRTVASQWTAGLRIYSPNEEADSLKTNTAMAVAPLGPHLSAAKWPASSVWRNINQEVKGQNVPRVQITLLDSIDTSSSATFLDQSLLSALLLRAFLWYKVCTGL